MEIPKATCQQVLAAPRQKRNLTARIGTACLDYLVTLASAWVVLGIVAWGGLVGIAAFQQLHVIGVWAVGAGLLLVLVYLMLVAVGIGLVVSVGQYLLDVLNPDWLYRLVSRRIDELWTGAQRQAAQNPEYIGLPEELRLQECGSIDGDRVSGAAAVLREWRYTEAGFVVQPQVSTTLPEGADEGRFYRIGVVQFAVDPWRRRVDFIYRLGPRYRSGERLIVRGVGTTAKLIPEEVALRWNS